MTGALLAATASSSGSPGWLKVLAVVAGLAVVAAVLVSALETVVLPRNSFTRLTRFTFAVIDRLLVRRHRSGAWAESLRDLYGPVALVSLPMVWMLSVIAGFTFIFWGVDSGTLPHSFDISGSSVTTLGFAAPTGSIRTWITFVEAIIGLGLVALLISYLPTIYGAHHDREKGIISLRPFTSTPPSGVGLIDTLHRFDALDNPELWQTTTQWLLELGQTHCAFPALCYFPETSAGDSWVATLGAILDTGALLLSASPATLNPEAARNRQGPMLALAHGVSVVVEIGRAAGLPIDPPVTLMSLLPGEDRPPPDISVTAGRVRGRPGPPRRRRAGGRRGPRRRLAPVRLGALRLRSGAARAGRADPGPPGPVDHGPPGHGRSPPPGDEPPPPGRLGTSGRPGSSDGRRHRRP